MKNYMVISAYAQEKEHIASVRIYNMAKTLKRLGNKMILYFPKMPIKDGFDYSFAESINFFPLKESYLIEKMRKIHKKYKFNKLKVNNKGVHNPNFLYENAYAFIQNNWVEYNQLFCISLYKDFQIKYSDKILKDGVFDNCKENTIIFTSSGPSIMNYFGYKIKRKYPNVFWVADYRDLNQNNPYKSDKFNFRGKKMDKLAFKYADLITTVSQGAKEQNIENAKNMGFDIRNKSYVLYNGYSKQEINDLENSDYLKKYEDILSSDKVVIVFTGTINPLRRIDLFLETIKKVDNVLFVYAGISYDLIDRYSKEFKIESKVINLKIIPKEEAEFLQKNADVLLQLKANVKENGNLPGKFYEYLQKNKKILSLGDSDDDYNSICKNLKNVDILPYDTEKIVEYLNSLKKEDLKENYDPNIERFSWENLAKEFDDFISQKLKERKSLR